MDRPKPHYGRYVLILRQHSASRAEVPTSLALSRSRRKARSLLAIPTLALITLPLVWRKCSHVSGLPRSGGLCSLICAERFINIFWEADISPIHAARRSTPSTSACHH